MTSTHPSSIPKANGKLLLVSTGSGGSIAGRGGSDTRKGSDAGFEPRAKDPNWCQTNAPSTQTSDVIVSIAELKPPRASLISADHAAED